jgi:hypothetical protein
MDDQSNRYKLDLDLPYLQNKYQSRQQLVSSKKCLKITSAWQFEIPKVSSDLALIA